jgi:hypothetical protein
VWRKIHYNSRSALAALELPSGEYLVAGESNHFDGVGDAWMAKVDSQGNLIWNRNFGGEQDDGASDIIAQGQGYLLVGYTDSTGAGMRDAWVIKVDAAGTKQWEQTFGDAGNSRAWAITATAEGDYGIAGNSNGDAWLLRGYVSSFATDPLILDGGEVEDYSFTIAQ